MSPKSPPLAFIKRLSQGSILADGAMGTMLHQSGVALDACFDELNVSDPDRVLGVHRAFIDAGSELIETNTFSANRYKLAAHGWQTEVDAFNEAAVKLARQSAEASKDRTVYVAGAIGPIGARLAPYGRVQPEQAFDAFFEQCAALAKGGVDVFILETFTDLNEITEALKAARAAAPNVPVIASMTFTRDDRTVLGDAPREVANALAAMGADVIGVNCSGGPSQLARIAQVMRTVEPDVPISAMPNAGFPETMAGRVMYPATPDYFGDYAIAFRDIGVTVIGGCCGTTPDHIRAMRKALDAPARGPPMLVPPPGLNGHHWAPASQQPTDT